MPHKTAEARREYHREYKRRNREKWKADAVFYDAARHANQRARHYGAPGILRSEDVRAVVSIGFCHYCGSTERLGIDHVIPLNKRGPNSRDNLVCCCRSCNASKFRQDAPHRWSRHHLQCVSCRTTTFRHEGHGLCRRCYRRARYRRDRQRADRRVA